ncbi:MAG: DUF4349 domain-containing protein, partial [Chloroflexi bacterium]|nr:DUF4349 domain-containing protein [Chloroflexota bacterium]
MKKLLLLVPILLLTLAVACSSSQSTKLKGEGKAASVTTSSQPVPIASPSPAIGPDAAIAKGATEPRKGVAEVGQAAAPSVAGDQASAVSAAGGAPDQLFDRKIIYDAELALKVKDVGDSFEAVRGIAKSAGGFVLDSSFNYEGERRVATLRLRVPAESFDDTLA